MLADRRSSATAAAAPKVVVIGAGFGGLSCGYQLARAGVRVTVVEARPRLGGRVYSLKGFGTSEAVDAGGEWIGLVHPTWLTYAKEFALTLVESDDRDEAASPIVLHGKRYIGPEAKTLWIHINQILQSMNGEARRIQAQTPWLSPNAAKLDRQSLAEAAQQWPGTPLERHGALTLMANDMNCLPERFSSLALLAAIAGGGVETFWSEREVYRCATGNQSLAFHLAAAIGEANLRLRAPVAAIDLNGPHARVILRSGAIMEADAVVLTAPPSTWEAFSLQPALPRSYWMSSGNAIKVLNNVQEPFWQAASLGHDSLSDGAVGMTWQGGKTCLTVFAGGKAAEPWLNQAPAQRASMATDELNHLYPGFGQHCQQQSFWLWPKERWTRCGHSAPAPGEVTRVYPRLEQGWQKKLFFAGEYASPAFYGSMEGGLQSGALVAKRLARQLNLGG